MDAAAERRVEAAVILAGGLNRRFPWPKGFIPIDGLPIIQRTLRTLTQLFDEVLISTNTPEDYVHLGVPLVGDVLRSVGPMAGIHAALLAVKSSHLFVVACDMPFVDDAVVRLVCERHAAALRSRPIDVTVPLLDGKAQPLFGVYCKTILGALEKGIVSGRNQMVRFLDEVVTNYVDERSVRLVDPKGSSFININTVEDYAAATRYRFRRGFCRESRQRGTA